MVAKIPVYRLEKGFQVFGLQIFRQPDEPGLVGAGKTLCERIEQMLQESALDLQIRVAQAPHIVFDILDRQIAGLKQQGLRAQTFQVVHTENGFGHFHIFPYPEGGSFAPQQMDQKGGGAGFKPVVVEFGFSEGAPGEKGL